MIDNEIYLILSHATLNNNRTLKFIIFHVNNRIIIYLFISLFRINFFLTITTALFNSRASCFRKNKSISHPFNSGLQTNKELPRDEPFPYFKEKLFHFHNKWFNLKKLSTTSFSISNSPSIQINTLIYMMRNGCSLTRNHSSISTLIKRNGKKIEGMGGEMLQPFLD
jgi:hypothetical protein